MSWVLLSIILVQGSSHSADFVSNLHVEVLDCLVKFLSFLGLVEAQQYVLIYTLYTDITRHLNKSLQGNPHIA